jgi:undecaprenyl-diphosphatase
MTILDAIILGIVEGLTEFLPISSTGHLILTSTLLGIPQSEFNKTFEIVIQLGAILSVVFLYFDRLKNNIGLWMRIIAAFIPTGIIGFILYKLIKHYLFNPNIVSVSLIIGGIIIIIIEMLYKNIDKETVSDMSSLSYKKAVFIGIMQSLATIPGTSRSAATIIGGLFAGMDRKTAVEFSFLLAIPTMFAATGYDMLKSGIDLNVSQWHLIAIGFVVSFFSAIVAVKSFIAFISRFSFIGFGVYRIIIGVVFLLINFRIII